MTRTAHKVAIVVFCEAEGVDRMDAAHGAHMAISHALRSSAQTDPAAQEKVGSTRKPICAHCGAVAGTEDDGNVAKHVFSESFFPDPDPDAPDYRPEPCPGTGLPPTVDTHPVVGFDRADGLPIYARIHDMMEAGMALGNGYLWAQPTIKGFHG